MAVARRTSRNDVSNRIVLFTNQSTIHGLNFIGNRKLHPLERLFWLVMVATCTGGAIALTISNFNRYIANPTVVSLQKDFRNWENPLPSVTACFRNKTNHKKASEYIKNKWNISERDPKFHYYFDFVNSVANISYKALDFTRFENDSTLNKIDLLEVAISIHPNLTGTLVTFDTKRKSVWTLMMTELGICYSVNTKYAHYLTYKGALSQNNSTTDNRLLTCHYLNGLCYARYDSDPNSPIQLYVHSFLDLPHATISPPLSLREREEFDVNYIMQETSSSPTLRQLSPYQRKCRFDDEPLSDDVTFYSTSVCFIVCRYKFILDKCGCRPFFYHKLSGKICNLSEMKCVRKYAGEVTKPPSQIGCVCPQQCEFFAYLPHTVKKTVWDSGYFDQRITFRWGVLHPTTKYRRDVLFGFEDLVGSFGGSLALFLGLSFISFVEIAYFFVMEVLRRLYLYIHRGYNRINNTNY